MTEQHTSTTPVTPTPTARPVGRALLGPLTIRDLSVLGAALIIMVASVLPITSTAGYTVNLWSLGGLFFLGIGILLPLLVAGLFVARRVAPTASLRCGSLSVDQFASVVASFATAYFFLSTVTGYDIVYLVGLIGSVILLAATVAGQWIPVFAADFAGRAEVPAHVAARDAVPAATRPAAATPVLALSAGTRPAATAAATEPAERATTTEAGAPWKADAGKASYTPGGQIYAPAQAAAVGTAAAATAGTPSTTTSEPATDATTASDAAATTTSDAAPAAGSGTDDSSAPAEALAATTLTPRVSEATPQAERIAATVDPAASAPVVTAEPFWFAVDRPQNAVDEQTRQFAFKLTPGAWILALEDRGSSFLVQDGHGKTGLLLDLVGIERAPEN